MANLKAQFVVYVVHIFDRNSHVSISDTLIALATHQDD